MPAHGALALGPPSADVARLAAELDALKTKVDHINRALASVR